MDKITINDIREYVHNLLDIGNEDDKVHSEKKIKHVTDRLEIHAKQSVHRYPKCVKGRLDKEMFRVGIDYLNKDLNISFYSSLVYIMNDRYDKLDHSDRITYVNRLSEKLSKSVTNKMMKNQIKECKVTKEITLFVSDFFGINIFVINKDNDELIIYSSLPKINRYNNNVILFCYKDNYEPILIDDKKLFEYNTVEALVRKDTTIVSHEETVVQEKEENDDDQSDKLVINSKMKYEEIAAIAKSHGIDLYEKSKKKTKNTLIEQINEKLEE